MIWKSNWDWKNCIWKYICNHIHLAFSLLEFTSYIESLFIVESKTRAGHQNSSKIQYFDLFLLSTIRVKLNSPSNYIIIPMFDCYSCEHLFQFATKRAMQIWSNHIILDTLPLWLHFVYLHMFLWNLSLYLSLYIYIFSNNSAISSIKWFFPPDPLLMCLASIIHKNITRLTWWYFAHNWSKYHHSKKLSWYRLCCLLNWEKLILIVPSLKYLLAYFVYKSISLVQILVVKFLDIKIAPTLSTRTIIGSFTLLLILSKICGTNIIYFIASYKATHSAS